MTQIDLRTAARTQYTEENARTEAQLAREREAARLRRLQDARELIQKIFCVPQEAAVQIIPDDFDGGYIEADDLIFLREEKNLQVFGTMPGDAAPQWYIVDSLYRLGKYLENGFQGEDRRDWTLITDGEEGARLVRTADVDATLAELGSDWTADPAALW